VENADVADKDRKLRENKNFYVSPFQKIIENVIKNI
jgi:DUF1365 family protein